MKNYSLKISCEDKKGLVYQICKLIYEVGANIEKNDEFACEGWFYFRSELTGEFCKASLKASLKALLGECLELSLEEIKKKNIIIFATKEAHALGDLLIANYSGVLNANILAVISNHDVLKDLVKRFNIDFYHIDASGLDRKEHEALILKRLESFDFELLVLAKYMRILSSDFTKRYENKIINIHHSFLPAFIGANPYKQAYERGVKLIGATAHFVNHKLDEGPIIVQDIAQINHSYNIEALKEAGASIEKIVLFKALQLVLADRVFIKAGKTVVF